MEERSRVMKRLPHLLRDQTKTFGWGGIDFPRPTPHQGHPYLCLMFGGDRLDFGGVNEAPFPDRLQKASQLR